ncbi:MAG: hypothetical protein K2L23_07145 [Odoribacter sp.]|nr:hypothetical protein [Odoribacter sp.]
MKKLADLKWLGVIALLVLGMSSCLKKDDSLNIYVQYPYLLQNDNGTFTPQIRLLGNDLQAASINVAGKNFNFAPVAGVVWELTGSIYAPLGELDSVPAGYYTVVATGLNGKTANLSILFPEAKKEIAPVELNVLEYLPEEKKIRIELTDSVQNAKAYHLMIKVPTGSMTSMNTYTMWVPYADLTLTGDQKLSATVSVPNLGNERYRFAVGASYGATIRISTKNIYVSGTSEENQ